MPLDQALTPSPQPSPAREPLRRTTSVRLPRGSRIALSSEPEPAPQLETPQPRRKIIHIDMDAFFASVEQRDHPELRGKPVAVGGSKLRGVVAAASYEARKFGVRSAMPSISAKKRCPELIFVKHRFDVYHQVSEQIRAIFADYTSLIEPLSLDEAYLDVTDNLVGVASATQIAEDIRARIRAETGLTASAGVSYNKFLAKLASDHRKPDGLFVITPRMGPSRFIFAIVAGPTPWNLPTGSVSMNPGPILGAMTNSPSGLRWSEASLARNLL